MSASPRDHLQRLLNFIGANPVPKIDDPVKVGVLGAAQVATYALIWPARRLPTVDVVAVAARDPKRAQRYAKILGVPRTHETYDDIIADPDIDVIYIGLPNGLHGEWSKRALAAGKHVLCEKPFSANAQEAEEVQRLAAEKGLLCREAFHYKEHPLNQWLRKQLLGGRIGELQSINVKLLMPKWCFGKHDIRFQPHLAGGTMMDAGCYCAHALRFFAGMQPFVVNARPHHVINDVIDTHMTATVNYRGRKLVGTLEADEKRATLFPIQQLQVEGTRGRLAVSGWVMPSLGHECKIEEMDANGRWSETKEVVYGPGESTYFHQLQRFADDVRAVQGKEGSRRKREALRAAQQDAEDCINNMRLVDDIYKAARLPLRVPTCEWVHE